MFILHLISSRMLFVFVTVARYQIFELFHILKERDDRFSQLEPDLIS